MVKEGSGIPVFCQKLGLQLHQDVYNTTRLVLGIFTIDAVVELKSLDILWCVFMSTAGVVINIECKTWAANIKPHKDNKPMGTVKFQLMID